MDVNIKQKLVILLIIPVLLVLGIIFSYPKESEIAKVPVHKVNTLQDFKSFLKPEMNIDAIKKEFGDPDDDIGSGIHIYTYDIEEGGRVLIGYDDSINYVMYESADGKQSRVIDIPDTSNGIQPSTTAPTVSLANPASTYCKDTGGKLEIKKDEYGGEIGYCTLPSGEVCDEWAYFKKNCGAHK